MARSYRDPGPGKPNSIINDRFVSLQETGSRSLNVVLVKKKFAHEKQMWTSGRNFTVKTGLGFKRFEGRMKMSRRSQET